MAPELIGIGIAFVTIALVLLMVYGIVRMEQPGGGGARA